jgi:hypothetical protein
MINPILILTDELQTLQLLQMMNRQSRTGKTNQLSHISSRSLPNPQHNKINPKRVILPSNLPLQQKSTHTIKLYYGCMKYLKELHDLPSILLLSERKQKDYLSLLISILNPTFMLHYLITISFNYIALLLTITHSAGAYSTAHQ